MNANELKAHDFVLLAVIVMTVYATYEVGQRDNKKLINAMVDAQIEREASKFCAPVEKLVREMSRCSVAELKLK